MALMRAARRSWWSAPLVPVVGVLLLWCHDANAQGGTLPHAAGDAAADAAHDGANNEDLIRMGQGLLGNGDLLRMGEGLIQHPGVPRHGGHAADAALRGGGGAASAQGGGASGGAVGGRGGLPGDGGTAGERVVGADGGVGVVGGDGGVGRELAGEAGMHVDGEAALDAAADVVDPGARDLAGALGSVAADGGPTPRAPGSPAFATSAPPPPAPHATGPLGFGMPRSARIAQGKEMPPKGAEDSPLRALGVPTAAVPAVATIAAVGGMAIWPFLLKTLTSLFKGFIAGRLKSRAKKTRKLDTRARAYLVGGFRIRPVELGSILVAAIVYGLAVAYAYQGRKLQGRFVLGQECLVLAIYYTRSVARFTYERVYKLPTQYKLWVGGAFLCLGSAYLGNTLGTVGFEVDAAKSPEDTERMVKLKAWLVVLALLAALGFFVANLHAPAKMLQSGRLMMSGTALAEVMPFDPMPGLKIYKWRPLVWAALFIAVVPTFFAINFVL